MGGERRRAVPDLVPIGRFSKMTRLSVKALRFYDEFGLLAPAWVDPSSGYRYYGPGQANTAEAIRILRSVEMPLDEIQAVLAADHDELVHKHLASHRERLAQRLADQERMLAFLEHLIERKGGIMPYEVEVREEPELEVVATRRHTSLTHIGQDIDGAFGAIMSRLGPMGVRASGAPFIVYHDVIDEQHDGDIEVCFPVERHVDLEGEVYGSVVPGGPVASTIHRGPYDQIGPAYHTLSGWIGEHGHHMSGPPREIYLTDPRSVTPEDLLTRIDWPIEPQPEE
jgi:effector-binding domain-containing protein